jgi:hypothetical protein
VSGREAVGISGAASPARTVHVPGGQVLAERHHSAACIECIAKGGSGRGSVRGSHTVTVWNVESANEIIPISRAKWSQSGRRACGA